MKEIRPQNSKKKKKHSLQNGISYKMSKMQIRLIFIHRTIYKQIKDCIRLIYIHRTIYTQIKDCANRDLSNCCSKN